MEVKDIQPQNRKKIIYFITKSVWGGASKYVLDLASGLDKNKFEVFIAAGGEGPLKTRAGQHGIKWIPVSHFRRNIKFFGEIASFLGVYRVLRREKPDVIHVNSSKAGGICGLAAYFYNIRARKKVKTIFTVHGWPFMEDRPTWQNILIKFFSRLTCVFYDTIIVISKSDFDIGTEISKSDFDKFTLIHNGIDPALISFLSKEGARNKLNISSNAFVIGTVGEWIRNKGWDILLEAIIPLFSKFPELRLVMIGSGQNPDKENLLAVIQEKNVKAKVITTEFLEDVAQYLKAFDIFAFPSRKEGLPYALLEAGLAELPIVASKVGGIPDVIKNEKMGILIPPGDTSTLRDTLERLIRNEEKRKKFGGAVKENVKENFSLAAMCENTHALYK